MCRLHMCSRSGVRAERFGETCVDANVYLGTLPMCGTGNPWVCCGKWVIANVRWNMCADMLVCRLWVVQTDIAVWELRKKWKAHKCLFAVFNMCARSALQIVLLRSWCQKEQLESTQMLACDFSELLIHLPSLMIFNEIEELNNEWSGKTDPS